MKIGDAVANVTLQEARCQRQRGEISLVIPAVVLIAIWRRTA